MKTKLILSFVVFMVMAGVYGQSPTLELTFTAVNSASFVQISSIRVMNRTQGADTLLFYPDTVLVLDYQVGMTEFSIDNTDLHVFQNYPNPIEDQTTIAMYIPEKDKVDITVTDLIGRQVIHTGHLLNKGYHLFRFTPGVGNLFLFTVLWKGHIRSIKLLHSDSDSHLLGSLEYIGNDNSSAQVKTMEAVQNFSFTLGDELLFIGYSGPLQSGILDSPQANETYTFQFASNIPCPGIPTVTYEGKVYNTIQIFSQCWLKENLNAGTMINGAQNQNNNGIKEKYCYNNNPDSCTKNGGLYQWNEMMQYTTQQGIQGLCPSGWHLPTDEEWKVLEGAVDSWYGIGWGTWDIVGNRGYDAGFNLKTANGWYGTGNGNNLFGFSGLPSGFRHEGGLWGGFGFYNDWWTSSQHGSNNAWRRGLSCYGTYAIRDDLSKGEGFSVRCLRDY